MRRWLLCTGMQRSSISGSPPRRTSPQLKEKTSGSFSRRSRRTATRKTPLRTESTPLRKRRSTLPPTTTSRWAESPFGSSGPPRRTARKRRAAAMTAGATSGLKAAVAPSAATTTTTTTATTTAVETCRPEPPSAVGTRYRRAVEVVL